MEITLKIIVLYIAILLTGLSAGLFYAWQVSVIPGTKLTQDSTYIETMQKINRAIINPPFMLIFLGSLLIQILSVILYWNTEMSLWLILSATLVYGAGTIIVTGLGNVPLNDALDELHLDDLRQDEISKERHDYEVPWNRLHLIRTAFAVLSFMLLLAAAFSTS
ncbi:anthrone oxygenase family protein [Rhodohalobacter sulfatireducens]|uniref:DUF1772 domain-containing protein n=1 Tax=Rhodohalobacter sulfatireducens TaxID=2911366 RepID=A0ABS9KGQ7_9BACT|nr:DUF1772 domain-containing protein [Rhodohalobacter sulfatireducens]MCG2590002.1 DUF1772 domain-containing protein [Rhodohalobacter sulfatireducens]